MRAPLPGFMSRKPSRTFYNEPINLDAPLARATSAQWCVCVISQPQICNLPRMSSLPNSKIGYIPYSPCQLPAAPAYSILRLLSSSTIERVLPSSLPMEQTAGIVFVSLGRVQVGNSEQGIRTQGGRNHEKLWVYDLVDRPCYGEIKFPGPKRAASRLRAGPC